MSEAPLITIITVVRNDVEGLRRTAHSMLGQDSDGFEWLIIDGESKDGTAELGRSLAADSRVKMHTAAPKGIYDAMNVGVARSAGQWFWLINAGDFLLRPDAVSIVAQWVTEDSPAAGFASKVAHVSGQGYLMDISMPRNRLVGDYAVGEYNHQGVVCRRDMFDVVGPFDTSLSLGADGKFLDALAAAGRVELRDDLLVGFTLGGASGRNYASTVAETNSFRPTKDSRRRQQLLRLRNAARVLLLDLEPHAILGAPARLLLWRKQEQRLAVGERAALTAAHWKHHDLNGHALFECCVRR